MADGIIFPTENVAQDYAETVGKNYRLPTVTISFDPSAIFAKPMPSVVIENQKIINASIDSVSYTHLDVYKRQPTMCRSSDPTIKSTWIRESLTPFAWISSSLISINPSRTSENPAPAAT